MRADLQAPLSSVLVRVRPRVLGGLCLGAALVACAAPRPSHHLAEPEAPRAVLVLHGGAGTIDRASMTPELEQDYRAALEGALRAGHAVLASGGSHRYRSYSGWASFSASDRGSAHGSTASDDAFAHF